MQENKRETLCKKILSKQSIKQRAQHREAQCAHSAHSLLEEISAIKAASANSTQSIASKKQRKRARSGKNKEHNRGRREKRYSLNAHCQVFLTINRESIAEKSRDRVALCPGGKTTISVLSCPDLSWWRGLSCRRPRRVRQRCAQNPSRQYGRWCSGYLRQRHRNRYDRHRSTCQHKGLPW